ncbi:MAG: ALG6, ALG8 glycosyltransferase family [Methanomassiliicoccales archaeon PtaU1.Bin124]|nr:MAG: ALG6, ALG8 glycosyltransferase family [Methanomassiliicoccales archaeon PtaU1.Bin124]
MADLAWVKDHLRPFTAKRILIIIVIGLAVRLLLAPWTSWTNDVYAFYDGEMGILAGIGPYGNAVYTYPPLFAVLAYPFVLLATLFQDPSAFILFQPTMVDMASSTGMLTPYVTSPEFNLAIKMPMILADLAMAFVLYHFVAKRKGDNAGFAVLVLWFLNPLVIVTGSVQGQFDVIPALLAVVGLISFIEKRYLVSGAVFGLGVLFKLFPVYLIIPLAIVLIVQLIRDKEELRERAMPFLAFVIGGAASLVTLLPFVLQSGVIMDYILRRGSYTGYGGLNIWFLFPGISSDNVRVDGVQSVSTLIPTLVLVAVIVISALLGLLTYRSLRSTPDDRERLLVRMAVLVLAVVLLAGTVTNPQYLVWLFPLLLLLGIWDGRMERKMSVLTIIGLLYLFSLLSMFALYYPLASFTDVVSITDTNVLVQNYLNGGGIITRQWMQTFMGGVGMIVLATLLVGSEKDLLDKAWQRFRGWVRA